MLRLHAATGKFEMLPFALIDPSCVEGVTGVNIKRAVDRTPHFPAPPRPPPPIEKCSGNFNADQCKKFDTRGLTCE